MSASLLKSVSVFFLSFCLLTSAVCLLPPAAYANNKTEAKKQIHTLHKKVQEASEAGDLQAAIEAAEQAHEIASEAFGEKSREKAEELNNVANLYMFAGHPAEAAELYKNAILIETGQRKKKDLTLADYFYNLAMAYAIQKKYPDARIMLKKAYEIRVKQLGEDHPDTKKVRTAQEQIFTESTSAS